MDPVGKNSVVRSSTTRIDDLPLSFPPAEPLTKSDHDKPEGCVAIGANEDNDQRAGGFIESSRRCVPLSFGSDKPIRVAIVDGDNDTRFVLHRILEQSGEFHCVGIYTCGEAAIRDVARLRPAIVLMDIHMPGTSGIQSMRRLKSLMPDLSVVLVSGLADPETMSEALAAGGDGYLTKPFTPSQCLATLTFALRHIRPGTPGNAGPLQGRNRGI